MPQIIPIPAVNTAIFNNRREILLTRRSPKVREPGKWCLPGGHLDEGETWILANRREIKEEVGLTVLNERLVGIYSDPTLTVSAEPLPQGHLGQFLVILFLVTEFNGEIKPNDEVDEWNWFSKDALPSPMVKSHPIRVEDAFRFEGQVFVR